MFVQIKTNEFVNMAKVARVAVVDGFGTDGLSYIFYGESGTQVGATEHDSPFNHDVVKALEKLKEY